MFQNDLDLSVPFYMVFPYSGGPVRNGKRIGKHRKTPKFSSTKLSFSGGWFLKWNTFHTFLIISILDTKGDEIQFPNSDEEKYLQDVFQIEDKNDTGKGATPN